MDVLKIAEGEKIMACKSFMRGVDEGAEVSERDFTTIILRSDKGVVRSMVVRGSFRMRDFPAELV